MVFKKKNQQSTTLGKDKIHAKSNMGNNYAVVNIIINKFIATCKLPNQK